VTSRRTFVASLGASLVALKGTSVAGVTGPFSRRPAFDIVLRGGDVFDGTGAPSRQLDVGILDGRIAAMQAAISDTGTTEIDARGLAVAPGFIDIHSHGDGSLFSDPRVPSVLRQGITTIVVGQDGTSRSASEESSRGESSRARPQNVAALLASFSRARPAVNVATMIGLGTVRGSVVGGSDRKATADELQVMVRMVEQAVAQGACGASSGLEYTPGAFASTEELIALCRPLASRGLCYATHMRNEDDRVIESIDESIAVARGAGCRLQISHLKMQGPRNWNRLDDAFARIAVARSDGIDVAFDRYPYIAYQTGLTNLFPVWSRDGGTQAFLRRVGAGATAARIRRETLAKVELIGGWGNVQITSVRAAADSSAVGKRLDVHAGRRDAYDVAVAMLRRSGGNVGMVGFAMSEENLDRLLAHPQGMVCSDGGAYSVESRGSSPHPRGLGSFPRVLGRYVRERKALSLEQAIQKMTALPASRLNLRDRGTLALHAAADLVVFDPARVADTATFEKPFSYPTGIVVVVVNGDIALRDGQQRNTGSGKGLSA
jgi:N-acyl-D-amino-acid deacylase